MSQWKSIPGWVLAVTMIVSASPVLAAYKSDSSLNVQVTALDGKTIYFRKRDGLQTPEGCN